MMVCTNKLMLMTTHCLGKKRTTRQGMVLAAWQSKDQTYDTGGSLKLSEAEDGGGRVMEDMEES